MAPSTSIIKLNDNWNAEPNSPDVVVGVDGADVSMDLSLNPFQFAEFPKEQRARLRFINTQRYRLGPTNDEGWYRGQCRFSRLAPAWGEFYEVAGDLRLNECPRDWIVLKLNANSLLRHFLFYLRDGTFECAAFDYQLDLSAIAPT